MSLGKSVVFETRLRLALSPRSGFCVLIRDGDYGVQFESLGGRGALSYVLLLGAGAVGLRPKFGST